MRKARTVAWLVIMWLIAGFAGVNLAYGLKSGLPGLGFVAVILGVAALAGSILPLVSGFELWDETSRQDAMPAAGAATAGGRNIWTGATGGAGATPVAPDPGAAMIVHEAGPITGSSQTCIRCGVVLSASSEGPWPWKKQTRSVPPGTWVGEVSDLLYAFDSPRSLAPHEAFCSAPQPSLSSWGLTPTTPPATAPPTKA